MQNYQIQYDALCAMREFLGAWQNNLAGQRHQYTGKVEILHESGIEKKVSHNFEKISKDDIAIIDKLLAKITDADIPYIQRQIRAIAESMDAAGY